MSNSLQNTKTRKMTEGDPLLTIFRFALPMICSNLFQQMYHMVDTIIVGQKLGTDALAAVGSASSITALFVQLSTGLALGGSIVIAQYFGAGQGEKIWSCTTTSAIFCGGMGALATVIIWVFSRPLLVLVNTPDHIVDMGISYLRFYFLGSVPIFVYNALNGVYVALGDSRTPLRFLIISSLLNVVLDLVFIMVFKMGVGGAALATALSQVLAAVMAVLDIPQLLKGFEHKNDGRFFDQKLLGTMLGFALPSALQQSVVSVGSVMVQATINSFGAAVIAGSAAADKIISFSSTITINYSNALANYVGQNMGAGKTERVWPGLRSSIFMCGLISLGMTTVFLLFPEAFVRIFIQEGAANMEQVLEVGTAYIRVIGAFLVMFSIYMLTKAVFSGAGDMKWFIFVTMMSFFIRLVLTVGLAPVVGVEMIWWSMCIGWVIAWLFALGRYVHGGWKKKTIVRAQDNGC